MGGAQGFGTERARLVVQVERLWCTRLRYRTCKTSGSSQIRCTRLRHRTCKTSGSSQKRACYLWGFRFFFLKIPPIFKLEVGFFSDRKTFAQKVFPGKFYYFGTNYERSFKRFAELFFSQNTPDF